MNPVCPMCGGTRTQGLTTFTADLGFGVVVVRHVPALVCDQCGENWLDNGVAETLESAVAQARSKHSIVDVTEWQDRAA
ncbi:type II toxin-antitoxin system MqsA family antitoxin [uncultured Thiodictyon sp.]|uniref:type II toxin-antitoxin system MqsA family antitoxin n=1 Tax=uncultured Thiodictyon sp. TaxID=1846217 RepID=UPI0025F5D935|nr:type II toxin-antitoxin system MqsA family antitoxin [uncultured Thiodictyon sp.]